MEVSRVSSMPAGYFLSAGKSLLTIAAKFILELNAICKSSQIRYVDAGQDLLWQSNTGSTLENRTRCALALLQNGTLQIREKISNASYWNSSRAGDSSVSWILKVDPDNGTLSVSDITNSSNFLWTNADASILPNVPAKSEHSIAWILAGVLVAGALVLAMAALGLYFCARDCFLDPADKACQKRLRANGGDSQALSLPKIKQATKTFGLLIGCGGFGEVFYGQCQMGKRWLPRFCQRNHVKTSRSSAMRLSCFRRCIKSAWYLFWGPAATPKHPILIYEYMGGGDLRNRLQGAYKSVTVMLEFLIYPHMILNPPDRIYPGTEANW